MCKICKAVRKDRRLPDAAIDLFDRTMAAIRMMNETSAKELELLKGNLTLLVIIKALLA